MTNDELREEVRALTDLNQRLSERIEVFTRRLVRHFDAGPSGGKNALATDHRLIGGLPRRVTYRIDEEDGGD